MKLTLQRITSTLVDVIEHIRMHQIGKTANPVLVKGTLIHVGLVGIGTKPQRKESWEPSLCESCSSRQLTNANRCRHDEHC